MCTKSIQCLNLAACCLNVTEGRNLQIIEDIALAAVANQETWGDHEEIAWLKSKAVVLSVYSDSCYNRANITIVAPLRYISKSVYQACVCAFGKIDLQKQNYGHPRLGVVDLIPIHPLSGNVSLKACSDIAHDIASSISNSIKGTSFYYFGYSDNFHRTLAQRRKEMKWFSSSALCKPDVGEQCSSYGISAIGAIPYMSVLNILLNTNNLALGKEIAASIRESNDTTGLPGINSMAFLKHDKIEIACNVETNSLESNVRNHISSKLSIFHMHYFNKYKPLYSVSPCVNFMLNLETCFQNWI